MASGQRSLRVEEISRPGKSIRVTSWFRSFMGNRAHEAAYGAFFASVFLLCQSPVHSLAIDDIRVLSKLGEPFVAEIAVTPAAGEVLNRGCFSTTRSSGDLPDLGTVRLTLTRTLSSTILNISGARPLREPLSELVLQVKCPGVPTMVKSFLVMVDPPTETFSADVATPGSVTTTFQTPPRSGRMVINNTATAASQDAIPPGSRYMVRSGDTLSTIASRVANRPDWSVWPIAQKIYASNPGAFLLGNPNVIAQGSVVFIPKLADVDMSLVSAPKQRVQGNATGPVANTNTPAPAPEKPITVAQDNGTRPGPTVIAVPERVSVAVPQPVATANSGSQIIPTPVQVTIPATPLPAMQLTATLLDESRIKIKLRQQGSPVMPAVVTQVQMTEAPVSSTPEPQTQPDRPNSATTDNRAILQPGQPAQADSKLNWLWIIIGLFTGLLIGALAAVSLFRRNLRHEYEHDVLDAVQRQLQVDRMRQQNQPVPGTDAAGPTATVAIATMDLDEAPSETDHTVEMSTARDLDFELSAGDEPAKTGSPETLEMPGIGNELDLNLPANSDKTGRTGQHEVDFDLLEAAYSDDYQSEFVTQTDGTDSDDSTDTDDVSDTNEDGDDSDRFYHLENRDPTDEAPLPIELGDDEMGDDDAEPDGKVVRFRR